MLDTYASRGIGDWFFHVYEDDLDAAADALLKPPGMHRRRGWMKFVTSSPMGRPVRSSLTVERVTRESAVDFATIVCGAFGLREVSIPLVAALANDERWQLFLSRDYLSTAALAGWTGRPPIRPSAGVAVNRPSWPGALNWPPGSVAKPCSPRRAKPWTAIRSIRTGIS